MPLSISSSEPVITDSKPGLLVRLVTALVLSVMLIALATEWLVRAQVAPQDTLALHLKLLKHADTPDAAFGDSHVARGFDAPDGFVNLAYPSENIDYIFDKVQRYYADKAPGRVILQADPHLFAPYRLHARFEPYQTAEGAVLLSATDRHRPRLWGYWTAFFEGSGRLVSKVTQTPNGALLSQGNFADLAPRRQQFEATDRTRGHALGRSGPVAQAQTRYLEMLAFLTERGADVCLVSFPVTAAYRAALAKAGPASGHAEAIAFFRQAGADHAARYVDARGAVAETALFRDVDHLNVAGAQAFAKPLLTACFDAP